MLVGHMVPEVSCDLGDVLIFKHKTDFRSLWNKIVFSLDKLTFLGNIREPKDLYAFQVKLDTCDFRGYSYLTLDLSKSWIILNLATVYCNDLKIEVGQ